MTLLRQVVEAVQASGGVVSLPDLSQKLGVQPAALQGMLQFCAQKGYIRLDIASSGSCTGCSASGCGGCALRPDPKAG